MSEPDWLLEQIKTCHNLCNVAQILIEIDRRALLPTILELLYQETQAIIDDHCITSITKLE